MERDTKENDERPRERRIGKLGPVEIRGRRRSEEDSAESRRFSDAWHGLVTDLLETVKPVVVPVLEGLARLLKRFKVGSRR